MQSIDIGHTRQLFIDGILLDSSRDVQHVLHQPQRCEPIISIDKAWEGGGVAYAVLFADDGLFRAWYRSTPEPGSTRRPSR